MLNVGDLKPAELDIEFFLKLAWNPQAWNGTNTCDLLEQQLARDFGAAPAPELSAILAEYYRLNFERKPEHMGWPTNNLFSPTLNDNEAGRRREAWRKVSARVDAVEKNLSPELHDAFFELAGYPVKAAAAMNEKCLAGSVVAEGEIHRLTEVYNNQTAGGKWQGMMSSNPRDQVDLGVPVPAAENGALSHRLDSATANIPGADFVEHDHRVVMEAEHASAFIPGKNTRWRKISGLGYNGEAAAVLPTLVPVCDTPEKIQRESPCLQYAIGIEHPGDWKFTVRALPTFSVETGQPQRYAIALDDGPLEIVSLPVSLSETDRQWQENVLRNAALASSVHSIAQPGRHTLKIWMVDPGIVLDTIELEGAGAPDPGYTWPAETRNLNR
jgi:hypothetical protein